MAFRSRRKLLKQLALTGGGLTTLSLTTEQVSSARPESQGPGIRRITTVNATDETGDGFLSGFDLRVVANTNLGAVDIFGPGDPYFEVRIQGETVLRTDGVARADRLERDVEIDEPLLQQFRTDERRALLVTVVLWDGDGILNDDLLDQRSIAVPVTSRCEATILDQESFEQRLQQLDPHAIHITRDRAILSGNGGASQVRYERDRLAHVVDAAGGCSTIVLDADGAASALDAGRNRLESDAEGLRELSSAARERALEAKAPSVVSVTELETPGGDVDPDVEPPFSTTTATGRRYLVELRTPMPQTRDPLPPYALPGDRPILELIVSDLLLLLCLLDSLPADAASREAWIWTLVTTTLPACREVQ